MEWTLPARPPFNLHSVTHSHGWIELLPFTAEENGPGFNYIDHLSTGNIVEYAVREASNGVAISVPRRISKVEKEEISRKIVWMLGLDLDFSTFYKLAQSEPKLLSSEQRAQGRVLRSPSLFEDTIKTILTTNTVWGSTKNMVKRLVDTFGSPLLADPSHHSFPTPQQIAASSPEILRSVVKMGYRAPYVHSLSKQIESGDLNLETFKESQQSTPDLRKSLLEIKGVGGYAAANLLMLLGRYDFIPVDSWALKMVSREWHNGEPVGRPEVEHAFERWGKWKGLAFWLWDWSE
jgi:3-methyladenine DNA glycosylase/8-oxoguanine DNA glycosylase